MSCPCLCWKKTSVNERNRNMNVYRVQIQIDQIDEDNGTCLKPGEPYEAGRFTTESEAVTFVEEELLTTRLGGSAADLLEACKVLTSYTMDLLYRLDNQVNISDIEEVEQARVAIAKYKPATTPHTQLQEVCRQILDSLDAGGELSRAFAEEIHRLKDILQGAPFVKAECPGCGARFGEWDFIQRVAFNGEAIYAQYTCKKCGSRINQYFTLTDISIDNRHAP